ncbi:NACHT, LRR and PYD domains-containing protein 13-like [Lytechinus variegatus]|uniref:NACHT, LRR and PYD domains-containing protein 13-like n=1 Tax=Lytechinus variegatus TaxID=7654 RepID=UPI001BB1ED02|nr:NACHT, LRR and PYD domains-containing protein 13-like [Lytechinus variegatus]
MPVAISEWRVRIGTFIHRIKEWVVREMREELLKERIQRLRVLLKRLKAKKDDSEGGSQDHKTRQDEVDSCDSSFVNQQGDCNAEPSAKTGQDSPQPCYVGSDTLHHEPSGRTVTSQTDSASLSTPTHPTSGLCLSPQFFSSFLSPSFYFCFPVNFLLFSLLLLPMSPGFGIPVSVSLPFLVVFLFLLSLFLSPFLPFSRRERSFGECHTCTVSPSKHGSGTNKAVNEQLPQQPNLQELMLVTAGDVELNPGPREGSIDSALQETELILLAKDVPGSSYYELSDGLGFSITEGKNLLTQHQLNFQGALIELFCRWKTKQRDDTDCRAVLGRILKEANMGSLQKRLLEGEYLKSKTKENVPNQGTAEQDMTEEEVSRCAKELKLFYRERMCKIKPDPLAFDLIFEFEEIHTDLTLLRNEMGITKKKRSLEYNELLTTKINGVTPKRLLVEGEGGVGKTTLCSKIAWDWTNGLEAYNHFSWVLVVPLRNVIKGEAIGDIMKKYLNNNNNVSPEQIANYMKSHPSEILIILDGFDEYNGDLSTDDTSDIFRILRLEMFKQCTVLVTTKPWRADQIKSNQELSRSYCFIAVEGFSTKNVSKYITKFFAKDKKSGTDLRQFIQENDVIKENMAPFPIYVAMLCVLWKDIGVEKRKIIRKLKTFSQLFEQMIIFLRDHYLSKLKSSNTLNKEQLKNELKAAEKCLQQIGSVAFQGLLEKKLVFKVDDFSSCKDAMTTSCRIGILSKEQEHVPRHKRSIRDSQAVTASVFFPHKLFQEYVAALYLASVYESDLQKYNGLTDRLLEENPREFRFLLYFTAAQLEKAGLDIVDRLHHLYSGNKKSKRKKTDIAFLVDVTFEAYHEDAAKRVGQWLDAEDKALTINKALSAHTVSGYLFINEHRGVKTLDVRKTKLGSSTSLVIANAVLSSSSLTTLKLLETNLHDNFYKFILDHISKDGTTTSNVQLLCTDHRLIGKLHNFGTRIELVFPMLKKMSVSTLQTTSPVIVQTLAHANLKELSIEHGEEDTRGLGSLDSNLIPLIGEPDLLGRLFSDPFPQLTSLVFIKLMMGNKRTESILRNLRKHQHLKTVSIIDCFTDDELDPLAEEINAENRMKITLQHNEGQRRLVVKLSTDLLDAICNRTSVCELTLTGLEEDDLCFPDLHGREVDSKVSEMPKVIFKMLDDMTVNEMFRYLAGLKRRGNHISIEITTN